MARNHTSFVKNEVPLAGKIIGTSAMALVKSGVFELAKMSVKKSFQGRGADQMLINSSIAFAKKSGN